MSMAKKRTLTWMAMPILLVIALAIYAGFSTAEGSSSTPTNLTATTTALGTGVTLAWDAPNWTVHGYRIERRIQSYEGWTTIVEDTGNTDTTYTDTDLPTSGSYRYRVRTLQDQNVSDPSNVARVEVTVMASSGDGSSETTTTEDSFEADYEAEALRLQQVNEDILRGCLAYEYESPHTGESSVTTSTDDAKCVHWVDLTDVTCFPGALQYQATYGYTVTSYDGSPTQIYSHLPSLLYFDGQINLEKLDQSGSDGYGYLKRNRLLDVALNVDKMVVTANDFTLDYSYGDGSIEGRPSDLDYDMVKGHLDLLRHRLDKIVNGESYMRPAPCRFRGDVRDSIEQWRDESYGSISLGSTAQGKLDTGPDLDLYQVDLLGSVKYGVRVSAVDPDDVDTATVHFDYYAEEVVDEIDPSLRILDGDGTELATAANDVEVFFVPASSGTYYLEVGHNTGDADELLNAGIYALQFDLADERTGDLAGDTTTTAALIKDRRAISAELTAGDTDWFRLNALASNNYTIVAKGDDSDGQTALSSPTLSIYEEDGSEADSDDYALGEIGGYAVLDFNPDSGGTYFIEVAGEDSDDAGHYTISLQSDDHVTLHDNYGENVTIDDSVTGTIEGEWDRDRIGIEVDDGQNWIVEVEPRGSTPSTAEFSLEIVDDPETAYSRDWHTTKREDGSLVLATVDTGHYGPISYDGQDYDGGTKAYFLLNVGLAGETETPANYKVTIRDPQLQEVTNTTDQYTDTIWAQDPALHLVTVDGDGVGTFSGSLNGDDDKDSFALSLPAGDYQIEMTVPESEAVVGMRVEMFVDGQLQRYLDLGSLTVHDLYGGSGHAYTLAEKITFRVINHVQATTLDYEITFTPEE